MIYMKNRLKLIPGLVFITLLDIGCEKGPIVRLYEEPIIANLSGLGQTLYTSDDPTKTNWKDTKKDGVSRNGLYIKASIYVVMKAYKVSYLPGKKEYSSIKCEKILKMAGNNFRKVYENGAKLNNKRVDLHYFEDSSGRVFDVKNVRGVDEYQNRQAYWAKSNQNDKALVLKNKSSSNYSSNSSGCEP